MNILIIRMIPLTIAWFIHREHPICASILILQSICIPG